MKQLIRIEINGLTILMGCACEVIGALRQTMRNRYLGGFVDKDDDSIPNSNFNLDSAPI